MFQTTRIKWALPLAALFFVATSAFAGVTVSSPTPGATSGSPVHFVASASSGHPIISMRIYVDNNSVFVTSSGSLNTSIPMSSGTHGVVVQAWDSAGAIYKSAETITVSGSAPPPSSSGVSVSSPTPGTTSSSPVHFVASASSSHPIISMRIYVDSNSVFVTSSGSLNTSVPMSSGSHSVVVQAWDSAGGIYKSAETITVSGSTRSSSSGHSCSRNGDREIEHPEDDWMVKLHYLRRRRRQWPFGELQLSAICGFSEPEWRLHEIQHQRTHSVF